MIAAEFLILLKKHHSATIRSIFTSWVLEISPGGKKKGLRKGKKIIFHHFKSEEFN